MRRLNKSYPYQKQLKNRSSKDLSWLTGPGTKSILRCVNKTQLKDWANREVQDADKELRRRNDKQFKRESK